MSNVDSLPDKNTIIRMALNKQVEAFAELMQQEFTNDAGETDIMAKVQLNGGSLKWYVEVPHYISVQLQHAIRDALAEKEYDTIHFNEFGAFATGFTRVSITIKLDAE